MAIIKRKSSNPDTVLLTFQLPKNAWAETVHVVGDFNDWNHHSHAMTCSEDEKSWHLTIEVEKNSSYQFRYLVNGSHWQNDWDADRYASNPFGGDNSVVET